MKILICDDEQDILSAIEIYLKAEGYETCTAKNGKEALGILKDNADIKLVILDVMMPIMDGISTLAQIRNFSTVPVILLTAKSEDTDKILGLNIGADDYITKPFNPMELIARVRSQLRRYVDFGSMIKEESHLICGGIVMDDSSKAVFVDEKPINLTPTEYEILKLLITHPGKVFSPVKIYEKIWDDNAYGSEGTVAVHIRHLRKKIEIDPSQPRYLKVVWGQGYKIEGKNHEKRI